MSALDDLVTALDGPAGDSAVTSFRQPEALRRATRAAVELGWAATANEGLNQALRAQLEAFAQSAALEEHYAAHPGSRPTLAEIALALAQLDGSPLAGEVELIERAAAEVVTVKPTADADDVLLWAHSRSARPRGKRKSA